MRKLSGSKLPLAVLCPASVVLPWIDEPVGDMAIRGTVIHAFLEEVAGYRVSWAIEEAVAMALEDAPVESHRYLRSLDLDALAEYLDLTPELAFALDWRARTARVLGAGLGRAYPDLGPTEIPLTVDLCGVSPARVRVSDYKTGRTRYGPAAEFWQLIAGALAACWAFGRSEAIVELVYLDDQGDPHVSRGELDAWDLAMYADELERTMDEVGEGTRRLAVGGMPDVHPGPHCVEMHCPAYRACPAKSALVRHMPEHVAEVQRPGYLAPERLAQTWRQLQEMRRILGAVEEEVRALSFREPIDLGDGTWLGPRERRVESVDAKVTHAVLTGLLGQVYADAAVTLETTKAAITEQAKLWRDRNPKDADFKRVAISTATGAGILDRILTEIRNRGGATVKVTNNPTVYKRKELP